MLILSVKRYWHFAVDMYSIKYENDSNLFKLQNDSMVLLHIQNTMCNY